MSDEVYNTRIFLDALAPSIISDVQDNAEALSNCSNYWIPRDAIESGQGTTATERAVTALHKIVGPSLPQDWAGAEYWVQIYDQGRGLAFHFDKDEHAMKEDGRMINPILSSVLYLTGTQIPELDKDPADCDPEDVARVQAPTVVIDQMYDQVTQSTVPENPTYSTFVIPRENCYCVFDGRTGHGVLESASKERRATLLVNWWQVKPENIDRIEESLLKEEENTATAVAASAVEASSELLNIPKCIYPEVLEATIEDLKGEEMMFLDDLLAARGKAVIGEDALHAFTIKHPGMMLFPLDDEQLSTLEIESEIRLQLASCLAPPSDSSSSEESA